jgi:hypothetical protein
VLGVEAPDRRLHGGASLHPFPNPLGRLATAAFVHPHLGGAGVIVAAAAQIDVDRFHRLLFIITALHLLQLRLQGVTIVGIGFYTKGTEQPAAFARHCHADFLPKWLRLRLAGRRCAPRYVLLPALPLALCCTSGECTLYTLVLSSRFWR